MPWTTCTDDKIRAVAQEHFIADGDDPGEWGANSLNQQWLDAIGIPFARAVLAAACGDVPNPAQLRTMARPESAPQPCMPGRHCERHARGLGACIAGTCSPPAPRTSGVIASAQQVHESAMGELRKAGDKVLAAVADKIASEPTRSQKLAAAGFTPRQTGKTAGGLMPEDDAAPCNHWPGQKQCDWCGIGTAGVPPTQAQQESKR